jgi:malate synthase
MTDISWAATAAGVEIRGPMGPRYDRILSSDALWFLATLQREFNGRRKDLLVRRQEIQRQIDAGQYPDFAETGRGVRGGDWKVASLPPDLQDRRVEITGPTDRKMVINALNSGARVFMADFEDSNSPTWSNMVEGQINLSDAIARTISFTSPEGKEYSLGDDTAVLMVRPRGWHLNEKHVSIDGVECSGSLFDFGLCLFHNARNLLARGTGPYFYLPKLENHLEARLWNDVFNRAQDLLGIPRGTIRATVLIENILAAFEIEEIIYELRDHSAGVNAGRWDYIFSVIKKFRNRPGFLLPDRAAVTMTTPMMRSYDLLTIQGAHRHDADAIGGMSAFIPVKGNEEAQERAIAQVEEDKRREATDGHDGTWVAHPGLVPVAMRIFDDLMPQQNQIDRKREDVQAAAADLLTVPEGDITEQGLRLNITVAIRYLESWLSGQGAVAIFNLMEDAATAEISRAQIWQWIHHAASLDDGRIVTRDLVQQLMAEEMEAIRAEAGEERFRSGKYDLAAALFEEVALSHEFVDFLTIPGYGYLP